MSKGRDFTQADSVASAPTALGERTMVGLAADKFEAAIAALIEGVAILREIAPKADEVTQ